MSCLEVENLVRMNYLYNPMVKKRFWPFISAFPNGEFQLFHLKGLYPSSVPG